MEKLQEDKTYLHDKNSDLQKEIKELENQNADFIQHVEDRYNMESRFTLSIDEESETCWKEYENNEPSEFIQDYSDYVKMKIAYDQADSSIHTQDGLDYG